MRRMISALALSLLTLAAARPSALQAADPAWYSRKPTWQETLRFSREALASAEAAASAAQIPAAANQRWSPWHHIGDFQNPGKSSFSEVFPPETEIDLAKQYGQRRWRIHPEWTDGTVHHLQAGANSATYLYRTVTVPSPTKITAYFGSDDGMAFWLNGKRLIARDVPRGVGPNQDQAELALVAGENRLLIKIHNQSGDCGFYFSTSPSPASGSESPAQRNREAIWDLARRDFSDPESLRQMTWERQDGIWAADWPTGNIAELAQRYASATRGAFAADARRLAAANDPAALAALRAVYYRSRSIEEAQDQWKRHNGQSLRLAINDLIQTHGDRYPRGAEFLRRLDAVEKIIQAALAGGATADLDRFAEASRRLDLLRHEALLANPVIDFDKLLLVKRDPRQLGLPQNWQGNCALPRDGYDNEIDILSTLSPTGRLTTLYRPQKNLFVGDLDLHFDADRLLFSMPGAHNRWQIWEMRADGTNLRQVTPGQEPDVDNYDPCYLPDGRILFASTACFHGVPCVGGGNTVANLFRMDADGRNIRQLCFDQDHNWCPTILNDGRVLYTRWEYSDTPHYFTRLLFRMNPDGTNQMEYYGSNSYWPNSTFYARPIPNHPNKVVGIISGHHGVPRMGELVIFDPVAGRFEADGAVQRIPGHSKPVPPKIEDTLVDASWPRFLHPYPLSEKHILVACQPTPQSNWGIYLVDTFDNMVLIHEVPGQALLEPIPLRKTPKPPVVPDRVNLASQEATVYLSDIYRGPGLAGVPRGTVKNLRIYEVHYAYPNMGGHINIGVDGPWDVHRIIGTVPVHPDGSAAFKVPANTPLAVQPLDAEGKAIQVMRSWFTAMPGETLSCVGCHERQNDIPPNRTSVTAYAPVQITPWRGPARGFSFKREVQPVLDQYCVGCHDGKPRPDGKSVADFSAKPQNGWRNFTPAYLALHPFVRRPGPESDYHLQVPYEFHADTSELIQMLKKGHYNVKLDAEAWDRLVTWIDLNVPDHGAWGEHAGIPSNFHKRRIEMRTKYANRPEDPEALPPVSSTPVPFVKPQPVPARPAVEARAAAWPFDPAEARRRQSAAGLPPVLKLPLSAGLTMEFVLVPAGEFVMGSAAGPDDEFPPNAVRIDKPYYLGRFEVTNAEYSVFDPRHNSGVISVTNKDQSTRGLPADAPRQPVVRVSWQQAVAYCQWMSEKTGHRISLPSEAQWEYACRAGAASDMAWGDAAADFSRFANLADQRVADLCRGDSPRWIPSISTVNDGSVISDTVGKYQPNAWGLHDLHGNVSEWTRSLYRPYPYADEEARNDLAAPGDRVVRGGSWYDRPDRARSAWRLACRPYQRIFNVGFRVVMEP